MEFSELLNVVDSVGLIGFLTFAWWSERRERQMLGDTLHHLMERMLERHNN
jgi:hypothetical protein